MHSNSEYVFKIQLNNCWKARMKLMDVSVQLAFGHSPRFKTLYLSVWYFLQKQLHSVVVMFACGAVMTSTYF